MPLELLAIQDEHKDFGYRRMQAILQKEGINANKKKVQRIMQKLGLQVTSYTRKSRRYNSYEGKVGRIAPNRIHRRFYTTQNIKVILCTPTWDNFYYLQNENWKQLIRHADQVRVLADRYNIGLADSFEVFRRHVTCSEELPQYLSHVNHPTRAGHQLIAQEIAKYFITR